MKATNLSLTLVALLGLTATAAAQQAAPTSPATAPRTEKIGVVDMQRALTETKDGKAALTQLAALQEKKQKELEAKRDELTKADADLAKQASVLKPAELERKRKELATKLNALQDQMSKATSELREEEARLTKPIARKLDAALAQIAQRDQYTLILRTEAVAYPKSMGARDVTSQVIAEADKQVSGRQGAQ